MCTISLFSFGWWYTLMKNKHQISLYLVLKKMGNILQITFSNGFCVKRILSVCLSVRLSVLPAGGPSVRKSVRLSVRTSVRLSVCAFHTFFTMFMVSAWNFTGMITNDRSDVYAKIRGQKSKVKVTEVKSQISHFRIITPVGFYIWWWNDAQSLILFRSIALLIFKVILWNFKVTALKKILIL